jgi:hypothetical protein
MIFEIIYSNILKIVIFLLQNYTSNKIGHNAYKNG